MRRAFSLALLLGLATSAQAEDFTGAYAGVNLGYGFERERGRDAKTPGAVPEARAGAPSAADLPPSASLAAKSLRASRPAASR